MVKITNNLEFNYKNPKIIAEISGNHLQSKSRFMNLIKSAFKNGADLVKIQTYEPEDITLNIKNNHFKIKSGIWKNQYLWDLYQKAHTPYKWHKEAFEYANRKGKILFSSPFSLKAVDFLEKLNVKLYKISSFEITDVRLVEYIAKKNKPIIISTGMASIKEISVAKKIINKYHNKLIILHCISNYPTNLNDANLDQINQLKKKFKKNLIGLSDHTDDIVSSYISSGIGVCVIEKHFTIDEKKTPDSKFSIKPNQLKILKSNLSNVFCNKSSKKNNINKNKNLRRSIFASKNIKKNERFTTNNLTTFRPNVGVPASDFFKIVNKKAKKNKKQFDPIFKSDY